MCVHLVCGRSRVRSSRPAIFFCGDWSWNNFYGHCVPSSDPRRAVVSYWRKNVHQVLVNSLGCLPRNSVDSLIERAQNDLKSALKHQHNNSFKQYEPPHDKTNKITCAPSEDLDFFMRTAKTLIRLGGCPGWSESSLGAKAILLVLSYPMVV